MIEMMDMEGGILKLLDRGIKYILEFNESIFVFRRGVKMSKKHLVVYYFENFYEFSMFQSNNEVGVTSASWFSMF